jgi:flavodoxin
MNTLIAFDSQYGNTEKIAKAIGAALLGDVKVLRSDDVNVTEMSSYDLLILGTPTYGGRPMQPMQEFMNRLSNLAMDGKNFAAFDTRLATPFVKVFGYAAPKIEIELKAKGGKAIVPAVGFLVSGSKPPQLKEGELEKAAAWAKTIIR